MSNDLVAIETQPDPRQVLMRAQQCASALKSVIENKPKSVIINGEQYLEYEDWQTLGQFYAYAARTLDAEYVEVNGVAGARAKAELVDLRTGEVMGGAEAYCMRDEDKWADRPWHQLASMAQTRAGAKAFRNRLAWIVVLAGYKATPAEELDSDRAATKKREHWCAVHNVAFKRHQNEKGVWYSHKCDDGSWCTEKTDVPTAPKSAPQPQQEKPAAPAQPAAKREITREQALELAEKYRARAVEAKLPNVKPVPSIADTDALLKYARELRDALPKEAANGAA